MTNQRYVLKFGAEDYGQYIYKIDNVKEFIDKIGEVNSFVDNKSSKLIDYALVKFKKNYKCMERGMYMFVFGYLDMCIKFIEYLDKDITDGSSYIDFIHHNGGNKNEIFWDKKLKDLFELKNTRIGEVIYEKEPKQNEKKLENERSLY